METIFIQIAEYLTGQSWQIAALVAVIGTVSLLLKNKSAHIRYLLWLILLAKCLVPPLLTIPLAILPQEKTAVPLPIVETKQTAATKTLDMSKYERAIPLEPAAIPNSPTIAERLLKMSRAQWLTTGWIAGFVLFSIIAGIKALRVNLWLRRERMPLPDKLKSHVEELLEKFGLGRFGAVWVVDGIGQPFVWGLVRGGIYLPANFTGSGSIESCRVIIAHELSHVLRFDAFVNLLQIIAQAIFWFHPFVWWSNKKIRAEREKCCDEMAIARLNAQPKDYGAAIVNTLIAEHNSMFPVPSLAVAGSVKNIEERIKTIMNPGKKFYKRPSIVAAILVLILALIIVPTTLALTERSEKTNVQDNVNSAMGKEIDARIESFTKLHELGDMLLLYANDNKEKYPDSLEELKNYEPNEQDFKWILENIEYLGKGKTAVEPPDTPMAYDKTLFAPDSGTNVLFNDCHVEFVKAAELEKRGILIGTHIDIETRLLFIPADSNEISDFLKRENLNADGNNAEPNFQRGYFLNSEQAENLLKLAMSIKDSNELTAPHVKVFDGESATFHTQRRIKYTSGFSEPNVPGTEPKEKTDITQVGIVIRVIPKIQADSNNIKVSMDFKFSDIGGWEKHTYKEKYEYQIPIIQSFNISTTFLTVDGQTILIGNKDFTFTKNGEMPSQKLFLMIKTQKGK